VAIIEGITKPEPNKRMESIGTGPGLFREALWRGVVKSDNLQTCGDRPAVNDRLGAPAWAGGSISKVMVCQGKA